MIVSWGKPKIEYAEISAAGVIGQYHQFDTPVEDSTELTTSEGEKKEAKEEGGGVVDTYRKKNNYSLAFELFIKKGGIKPIEDNDGIIEAKYAIRVTPEDGACVGFILKKCSASVQETWKSADGGRWKYTFDALVPSTGKMLEPYIAESLTASPSSISMVAAGTAQSVTITGSTGALTATTNRGWITATVSGTTVSIAGEALSGTRTRSGIVTIADASGNAVNVVVTQTNA